MNYVHPDVLTDTETISKNLNNKSIKIVEVDYDPENAYRQGHVQGASLIWWKRDINDPISRDIVNKTQFEELMSRNGITSDSEVILYGDFNNWFAAFVFWIFKYYGHEKVIPYLAPEVLSKKPYTKDETQTQRTKYVAQPPNEGLRAYLFDVKRAVDRKDTVLVDVRSPKEFSGEITAPPEYPMEHAQRGGHIPGANNIPWASAVNDTDGTFKAVDELKKIYESKGVTSDKDVVCYCRIGERSSHTWFVLKYLLRYPQVRKYDGYWTEWGNMIGNPIER